ncbi:TolC family protein [Dokdonella sp. MW10]|uniref:TolC family protein n=1 Tax=Dokdonella sp. MW10 TaxID=2992926 RepID=UPI003F807658
MIGCPRGVAGLVLVLTLTACASYPARRGVEESHALASARGVEVPVAQQNDCMRLPQTDSRLSEDDAVRLALQCNAAIAAAYARLGIARAEAFEAGRLANPSLSLGVADSNAPEGGTKISLGLAQNFTNLILRGPRTRLAEGEFERAQQLLAGDVLVLAADTAAAYHRAVGAVLVVEGREAIAEAREASAELAARFHAAGNMPARERAVIETEAVLARIAAREARDAALAARLDLQRQLGIAELDATVLPDALEAPAGDVPPLAALRELADAQRLDLAASRRLVDLLADSTATTRRLRWLGEFEVGVEIEREPDRSRLAGPTLSIQLPLFHQGQGALARAEATQAWSDAERRRLALEVRTAVDLAQREVESARARIADHRDALLPRRAAVVARTQEEVNFMLRGVFELVDARVDEYEAAIGYFEALRDYRIARASLEAAVGARIASDRGEPVRAAVVLGLARDADAPSHDHGAHDHGSMDHSGMDHSGMDHSGMDHSGMDHSGMDHSVAPPAAPPKPAAQPAATTPKTRRPTHDPQHGDQP